MVSCNYIFRSESHHRTPSGYKIKPEIGTEIAREIRGWKFWRFGEDVGGLKRIWHGLVIKEVMT